MPRHVNFHLTDHDCIDVRLIGEAPHHRASCCIECGLIKEVSATKRNGLTQGCTQRITDAVVAVNLHACDPHRRALVDANAHAHLAAMIIIGTRRMIERQVAAHRFGGLDVHLQDARLVVTTRMHPANHALLIALKHALIKERPWHPGPGEEIHAPAVGVEGRLVARGRRVRADVEAKGRDASHAKTRFECCVIECLQALHLNAGHAIATIGDRASTAECGEAHRNEAGDSEQAHHGSRTEAKGSEMRVSARAGTRIAMRPAPSARAASEAPSANSKATH